MHLKPRFLFIGSLLLLLTARPSDAVGQEREDGVAMTYRLPDTVVVTASRLPIERRQTGRRVVVWTAEDLAAQPALTITEVLRTVGGVAVESRAGFGVQSDFTMRGSNFKGVLILLDGMPLNGPNTAHYLSDFPVPLSAIARIEVLRGPASALYGPDAVGGVIQLFTYAGLRTAMTPPVQWEGGGHARYGAHALYDAGATLRHTWDETTFYAATAWQGTDGESIFNAVGERVRGADGPISTDFTRQTHTAALTRPLGGAMLYARFGMDRRDFNAYHFYTDFESDRARGNNRAYWLQARLRSRAERNTRWQVQLAAKQNEGLYVYNPKFSSNRDYSRMLVGQAQLSRAVTPHLTLTGGASGEVRGIESASMGNHGDLAGGLFLAGRWQAAERLTVGGSGRVDYDAAYGLEATPHLSIAYNLSALTLRAAAGRAVRAPTYTERYIDTEVEDPAGNLGNPDLEAEEAWSAEAGVDVYPLHDLSFHATAFYRTTDQLIDWAKLPGEELYVARNILSAETRGLELDAHWRHATGAARWSLRGSYTRLWADLGEAGEGVEYKYALKSARQLFQGSARLTAGRFTLGLRGLYKDRRSRPSYGVVHGRMAYRLPWRGSAPVSLSLEIRNLFDVEYADIFDAPLPGRWWIIGVRFGW